MQMIVEGLHYDGLSLILFGRKKKGFMEEAIPKSWLRMRFGDNDWTYASMVPLDVSIPR